MELTITHTHAEGTMIDGTSRGDGSADVLKVNGWRWSRNLGAWYVPHSRFKRPNQHKINATRAGLETAGFTVEVDLDETTLPVAEVEALRAANQEGRVAGLAAKAARRHRDEAAAWDRHESAARQLPPMGEPIKVGHHSEGRHRRAAERTFETMGKWADAYGAAKEADAAVESARVTTQARHAPVTVANRIEKLSADLRREQRGPNRADLVADLAEQVAYWEGVRAEQIASGQVIDYGPGNVAKGDLVQVWKGGDWHKVVRVNKKSVTVTTEYSWTRTLEYHKIAGHKTAEQAEKGKTA